MKVYNALSPEAQAEVQKLEDQRFAGHAKPFVDWVRTHVPALALEAQESYVQHKPVHPVHDLTIHERKPLPLGMGRS